MLTPNTEQPPSLLTIILDTNPAAWYLLADHLSLSDAVSDLLIFVNAHLASNYANKVAVIASHCSTAKWLYPTPAIQAEPRKGQGVQQRTSQFTTHRNGDVHGRAKQAKNDEASQSGPAKLKLKLKDTNGPSNNDAQSNKYRPFRVVEEEVIHNLSSLLAETTPTEVANTTSTMIAGALTLALSHINREMIAHAEANGGGAAGTDSSGQPTGVTATAAGTQTLQSRIFVLSVSPSTDLAHQYIPIMNSIFACQRLTIPIDICQVPILSPSSTQLSSTEANANASTSTVFLQQASDATHGIYIPLPPPISSTVTRSPTWTLLPYLLHAFLPSPSTRRHLILPTRIDVDFRAACFCHRRVVDIGFVCSICLSIFCSVPEGGECLTCGTVLGLGDYGSRPVVVAAKKKKKKKKGLLADGGGSGVGTPTPTPTPGP